MFRQTLLLAIVTIGLLIGCTGPVANRSQPDSDALADDIERTQAQLDQARDRQREAKEQLESARQRLRNAQQSSEQVRKRQEDVQNEIQALDNQLEQQQRRITALQQEGAKFRQEADNAQKKLDESIERSEQLRQQLKKLDQAIELLKSAEKTPPPGSELPKVEVELIGEPIAPPKPAEPKAKDTRPTIRGTIKEVQESGRIVVSMGSDAGLKEGDTLEVFRLKPKPMYLGQIKVVELKGTEAVARKWGTVKDTIRAGDEAATRILDDD